MRLDLADIVIEDRSRKTLRNIKSLAHSIQAVGLLHPPVVRSDGDRKVLVCGQRRIEALKSLGWTSTPVTLSIDASDDLEALMAESDENTEREPFTAAEAVEHRRRIRVVVEAAAKELQRDHGGTAPGKPADTSSTLEQVKPHERTTRARTAKATGFGATTLDKAEEIIEAAADETQPDEVREAAKTAAANLDQHGARVGKEFKEFKAALAKSNPDYAAATYRQSVATQLVSTGGLVAYRVDRVVETCDEGLLQTIDETCEQIAAWHQCLIRARSGLRVLKGGHA
jgi:hypothetical protein